MKDCRLRVGSIAVRLLAESVVWNDGTWHTVDPIPLKDDTSDWERVRLDMLSGQPILQLWVWSKSKGELKLQTLHWFVTTSQNRKLNILAEGVVRRRRLSESSQFLYDAWEKHSLKVVASGQLEWRLNEQVKTLPSSAATEKGK